jgi:hypothetical protein
MKRLPAASLLVSLVLSPLAANWEYGGGYRGYDGRLVVSFKGGAAIPFASMKNDLGNVIVDYWADGSNKVGLDDGGGANTPLGIGDLGTLPVAKKYDSISWAGGASVGMVLDGGPNVRMELDWLHVAEADYDANPLLSGDFELSAYGTAWNDTAVAKSVVSTDIISAMIYYDFFNGSRRPSNTMIPYVGVGLGYASSTAVLRLSDPTGELSYDLGMQGIGDCQTAGGTLTMCDFYSSETRTSNFAVSGALGVAYGMGEGMFLDIGGRVSYVPKIKWGLNNSAEVGADVSKERDVFSANDILFMNIYVGLRFEF